MPHSTHHGALISKLNILLFLHNNDFPTTMHCSMAGSSVLLPYSSAQHLMVYYNKTLQCIQKILIKFIFDCMQI